MSSPLDRYRALRDRIDRESGRLVDLHCKHITCHAGCSGCCADLTVWPVEYDAILDDLRRAGVRAEDLPEPPAEGCAFLNGHLCSLYRFRPLICRTHGLPVAFAEGDEEERGKAVSFCPLNFTSADEEDLAFGPESTLDLDALNAELAAINADHAAATDAEAGRRRVPLRMLRADLAMLRRSPRP